MNPLSFFIFLSFLSSLALVQASLPRLLVYSRCAGFRHDSIEEAIQTIRSLGDGSLVLDPSLMDEDIRDFRWDTVATEDESLFDKEGWLDQFDAIAFVMVTLSQLYLATPQAVSDTRTLFSFSSIPF